MTAPAVYLIGQTTNTNARSSARSAWLPCDECRQPVCSQPGGDVSSRDLCHDVAPEKRSVNHSHRFWIPVELGFLMNDTQNETSKMNKSKRVNNKIATYMSISFKCGSPYIFEQLLKNENRI